jgi:hypothetical protein
VFAGTGEIGKEECSFLKKRTKKLLLLQVRLGDKSATANKSFLLLFFKKEGLPSTEQINPSNRQQQEHQKNHDRDKEADLGDAGGSRRDTAEPQNTCHNGNDCEQECIA